MNRKWIRSHILDAKSDSTRGFRTAVSLHCHTYPSKESLHFIPYYACRIPVISYFFKREIDRYRRVKGKNIDFSRMYWTPPLSAHAVFELETKQIERNLGLQALVSLTNHDDIEAGKLLRVLDFLQHIPISVEWTVPFGMGIFHLGVHNLPPELSTQIMNELVRYTSQPEEARLGELLAWLDEFPETLVILNHPLWDFVFLGLFRHRALILKFLKRYLPYIHALEVNGYRSWRENLSTVKLAEKFNLPVISGGDRHGCAPNSVLNLTNAGTFAEFVSEIRYDRTSKVLLLPEYREHLLSRTLEAVADILRYYPQHPEGQQRWMDRTFIKLEEGVVQPLSYYWQQGGPAWVRSSLRVMCLLGSRRLRPALRLALARGACLWS